MTNLLCHGRACIHWKIGSFRATNLSSRPERTRISCLAALDTTRYAAFSQRKPHEIYQRHQVKQEIWGSAVERSAVSKSHRAANQGAVEKPNTVTLW
jgi:hypothetical protein